MSKAQRKPVDAPAADRIVDSTDNMSPEAAPLMLAGVDDLPTMMRGDLEKVTNDAVLQLDTYSRIPDVIESDDIYQRVVTVSTKIKGVIDDIEARRGAHKRPYLDATQVIDGAFKLSYVAPGSPEDEKPRLLKAELEAAHKSLKGRLSARDTVLHRQEQARIAEERDRLAALAAADGIEMSDAPVAAQGPVVAKSVHGGMAQKKVVKVWSLVDIEKLPRSLLMPDPDAIQKLLDAGAKEIPGLKIEEVVDTHTKRR